jgi:3-oxoacyl-[acyl-carrier-protein] synthase II
MSCLVAGMGAVSSVGGSVAEMFEAMCAGRSGLAELRGFDRSRFRSRHGYEIDDRAAPGVDRPLRATGWLLAAVEEAVRGAGLGEDLGEVPVLVGTTLRELRSVELGCREGRPFDPDLMHFGAALRQRFAATTTYTLANACAAGLYALALAADMVELGEAETVVVAGVDTFTESTYGLLDRCYPQPPEALRPFDRQRRGMVQGEGAAAVVLRREPAGSAAGDAPARVRGVGVNCDAHHPSAPDPASIERAIRDAYARARLGPAEIDLLLLHGTGTPLNDEAEAAAVGQALGAAAGVPLMTAVKSAVGHTGGASGLHALVTAVQAMRTGLVPPVLGLTEPIEAVRDFRLVRDRAAPAQIDVAQVNSFGFGGLNAVAVLERVV